MYDIRWYGVFWSRNECQWNDRMNRTCKWVWWRVSDNNKQSTWLARCALVHWDGDVRLVRRQKQVSALMEAETICPTIAPYTTEILYRLRSSHSCWSIGRRDFSTDSDQLPLYEHHSSWLASHVNLPGYVCRQVFLGRPLLLLPPSGTHCNDCIATLAGLSDDSRSICRASVNLLTLTIFDRSSIPALLINSSLVMWSRHEMVRKHLRWKTSNVCEILVVPFHVSAA